MKNSVNISYDTDKLSALEMFLEQKNTGLNDEILNYVDTLYLKNVPQNVRDFIDIKAKSGVKSLGKAKIVRETEVLNE